jgi:pimeloyl-ACP methyl ester carboxylesterase
LDRAIELLQEAVAVDQQSLALASVRPGRLAGAAEAIRQESGMPISPQEAICRGVFPVSVEAISWALNLPAVRTLIRYTCLSERIVQTAGPTAVIEAFGRLGGDEAAAVVRRIFAGDTEVSQADFNRVCYPLYSGTPGWAEESRQWMARTVRSTDVGSYYSHEREIQSFDPWSVLGAVRCPMLVLAGEDDPICPLPVVEELASQLPKETARFARLPCARHTIFRDRPDLAFPAVRNFVSQIGDSQPAS